MRFNSTKKLFRRSALVSGFTSVSRILGLFRDILLANFFGAGAAADAFLIAFRIPNFFRRLFAEGAFSQAFIPVLSEYKCQKPELVQSLIDAVAGTLGGVLLLIVSLGMIGSSTIVDIFMPGFYDTEKCALVSYMLRITFPYLFFIALTAFSASILNTYNRFILSAITPVFLNISLIGALLYLTAWFEPSILALAWGVFIAGVLQLSIQIPFLSRYHLLPRPKWHWRHPGVQKIMALMLPAILSGSVTQLNFLMDSLLASFLETGSISWLYYADRLVELPLGIFGIAIASVILPNLSKHSKKINREKFSLTLNWAVRLVFLLGMPATAALMVLPDCIMNTLFSHGCMTDQDIIMTVQGLRGFSLGLIAFMLIKILSVGFFAQKNTKIPMKIAIKALCLNFVMNLILMGPFAHVGLALATSLSAILNAIFLWIELKKTALYQPIIQLSFIFKISMATIIMVSCLIGFKTITSSLFTTSIMHQMMELSSLVILGLGSYFVSLRLFNFRLTTWIAS